MSEAYGPVVMLAGIAGGLPWAVLVVERTALALLDVAALVTYLFENDRAAFALLAEGILANPWRLDLKIAFALEEMLTLGDCKVRVCPACAITTRRRPVRCDSETTTVKDTWP
jgi:hypothetical protein